MDASRDMTLFNISIPNEYMDELQSLFLDPDIAAIVNGSSNASLESLLLGDRTSVFRKLIHYLDLYLVPVIALVGLIGNVLSFVVFVGTYIRHLSSSIYLAALSVADSGFLLCILVSWGVNSGLDLFTQNGWCQTFIYLTYVSTFLSVWYVVAFTVERYIAVHFPLKRQELCTTRRAKFVVVSLAVLAAVLYVFGTWTSGVTFYFDTSDPMCGPLAQYLALVSIINHLDTVITLILPFIAILVMNLKIAGKVVQFYRDRKDLALDQTTETSDKGTSYQRVCRIQASTKTRALYTRTQVRVTKMLLTVSTMFLLLNLPRHTTRTYLFFKTLTDEKYQPTRSYVNWQRLFELLYYMHFSVNLFLYTTMGKNFRKALIWLCKRIKYNICEYWSKWTYHCTVCMGYKSTSQDMNRQFV